MHFRLQVVALGFVGALLVPIVAYSGTYSSADIETLIRAQFPDAPVMVAVARCESRLRQFTEDGMVLYGGTDRAMVGLFQINAPVHADFARTIGIDINTVEGNIAYAKYLYDKEGTRPWRSSSNCWSEAAEIERLRAIVADLTATLRILIAQRLLTDV